MCPEREQRMLPRAAYKKDWPREKPADMDRNRVSLASKGYAAPKEKGCGSAEPCPQHSRVMSMPQKNR